MATIPRYQQQVSVQGLPGVRFRPAVADTSGIAQGLQAVGGAMYEIAQAEQQKQERAQLLEADTALAAVEERVFHDPENGAYARTGRQAMESQDDIWQSWDDEVSQIQGRLPSRLQERFSLLAQDRRNTVTKAFNRHIQTEAGKYADAQLEGRLTAAERLAASNYTDPERIGREVDNALELLSQHHADKPPEWLAEERISLETRIRGGALEQMLARDPDAAEAEYEQHKERMTPEFRAKFESELLKVKKALQIEARAELVARVEDSVAAYTQGLNVPNPPKRDDFRTAFGRKEGDARYADFREYQSLGKDLAAAPALTADELVAFVAERRPVPGEGFADASKRYAMLIKHVVDMENGKQSDPAQYVLRHLNVDQSDRDAFLAEQERIGVRNPRLLTNGQVSEIVHQYQLDDSGGSNAARLIEGLAEEYGPHWPTVFRQLAPNLPAAAQVIGTGLSPSVAAQLARVAGASTADLKSGLDSAKAGDANRTVNEELLPLQATLSLQGGGLTTFAVLREEAERLSYVYMSQGMDADEAGRRAASDIALSKYTFSSTYRVPIEQNADAIEEGAKSVLSELDFKDLNIAPIPGVSDEFNAGRFERLKEEAYWVTTPNEDGLVLFYDDAAVPGTDGPIRFTWQELTERASPSWWDRLVGGPASSSKSFEGPMPPRNEDGMIAP